MKIDARFGTGEIEIVNLRWMSTPVELADCVSSRIQNGSWGYGMGTEGEDLSYLGDDITESVASEDGVNFFLNGIYCFVREGRNIFKNISLEIEPSLGRNDSWLFGDAEIIVSDGVVKDLDPSPEYGNDVVRNLMVDFGFAYCDLESLRERHKDNCVSDDCAETFEEWLRDVSVDDLMRAREFLAQRWLVRDSA